MINYEDTVAISAAIPAEDLYKKDLIIHKIVKFLRTDFNMGCTRCIIFDSAFVEIVIDPVDAKYYGKKYCADATHRALSVATERYNTSFSLFTARDVTISDKEAEDARKKARENNYV